MFFTQLLIDDLEASGKTNSGSLDRGTFRNASGNKNAGRGIYVMLLEICDPIGNKSTTGTMAGSKADKRSAVNSLNVVVVSLDGVPVAELGDFPTEKELSNPDGPIINHIGRMFQRTKGGSLKVRSYGVPMAGEKVGTKIEVPTLFEEDEKFILKVGYVFKFNVFQEPTKLKRGDIYELVGWKLTTQGAKRVFINATPTNNQLKGTEMFPLCFKLGTLFSYPNGGRMIPNMESIYKSKKASDERHELGEYILPMGEKRMIHRGYYHNHSFLLSVSSSVPLASYAKAKTPTGELVSTTLLPCFEYSNRSEPDLIKLGKMSQTIPSGLPGNTSNCKVSQEDIDLYYSSYSVSTPLNYPLELDDLKKKSGDKVWFSWGADLSVISWGGDKQFFDPNHKSPVSLTGGSRPNLTNGLIQRADGTVDHYEFSRQILAVLIPYEYLSQLGPKHYTKLSEFLLCHRVGFTALVHPDVDKTFGANPEHELELLPEGGEEARWTFGLSEETQEAKRDLSNGTNFNKTHGVLKTYIDRLCWHLPEYLEVKGIVVPRSVMEVIYGGPDKDSLKNAEDPSLKADEINSRPYTPEEIYHQAANGQTYTYLNACAKGPDAFSKFGPDYEFYALACPVSTGGEKVRIKNESRLAEVLNASNDLSLGAEEKAIIVSEYLDDCPYAVHYYAVNKKLIRSCRNEAKVAVEKSVAKIKSKRDGSYFRGTIEEGVEYSEDDGLVEPQKIKKVGPRLVKSSGKTGSGKVSSNRSSPNRQQQATQQQQTKPATRPAISVMSSGKSVVSPNPQVDDSQSQDLEFPTDEDHGTDLFSLSSPPAKSAGPTKKPTESVKKPATQGPVKPKVPSAKSGTNGTTTTTATNSATVKRKQPEGEKTDASGTEARKKTKY